MKIKLIGLTGLIALIGIMPLDASSLLHKMRTKMSSSFARFSFKKSAQRFVGFYAVAGLVAEATQPLPNLEDMYRYNFKPCDNPDLLEVFNTIKQDLGIVEDIPLYVTTNNHFPPQARYYPKLGIIALSLPGLGSPINGSKLIHVLSHELGHVLQHNDDAASYQCKLMRDNHFVRGAKAAHYDKENEPSYYAMDYLWTETGADANAAGYQDCHDCLKFVQNERSKLSNQNYFSQQDFQPYIDRAQEHNWQCPAHQNPDAPHDLKDYLPQRDRSGYPLRKSNPQTPEPRVTWT